MDGQRSRIGRSGRVGVAGCVASPSCGYRTGDAELETLSVLDVLTDLLCGGCHVRLAGYLNCRGVGFELHVKDLELSLEVLAFHGLSLGESFTLLVSGKVVCNLIQTSLDGAHALTGFTVIEFFHKNNLFTLG